ncbi:MAG: cytochrome C oxidase subunit IV family protein [Chloroflexota bacterium]|nr:cytochrome C oxidase subunit IV family protein [Chloroflexota bacterium]
MAGRDATIGGGHGPGPAQPGTKPGTDHAVDQHENHPGERTYINVAIVLAVITAIEVAIYYVEALEDFLVPILIVLSIAKFIYVVGYFMHLKFDDRRFRWVFLAGLVISTSAVLALLAMFWTDQYYFDPAVPTPAPAEIDAERESESGGGGGDH